MPPPSSAPHSSTRPARRLLPSATLPAPSPSLRAAASTSPRAERSPEWASIDTIATSATALTFAGTGTIASTTTGVTQRMEKQITDSFPNVEVVKKENAARNDHGGYLSSTSSVHTLLLRKQSRKKSAGSSEHFPRANRNQKRTFS